MDKSTLVNYFAGDEAMMKKFVNLFLENAPTLANRLDEALADADWPTVEIAAHTLKGQLQYFSMAQAVEQFQILEDAAAAGDGLGAAAVWAGLQQDLATAYRELIDL